MSTLSELLVKVRNYMKSDPNDQVWSTSIKTSAINTAYFQLQKDGNFNWAENQAEGNFTTTGTQEYAISTYLPDFIRMDFVQFSDTAGELTPTTKLQATRNSNSGSSRPSRYYIWNNKIGFYPAPDGAYPVQVLYRKKLPSLTTGVGSEFSVEFDEAIVLFACYKIWSTTKNMDKARQALSDFQIILNNLKMSYLFNDTASLQFPFQKNNGRSRQMKYDPNIL